MREQHLVLRDHSRFVESACSPLWRQDVCVWRLYDVDTCWLAFWLERKIYVVPLRMAFGGVTSADVIRPTCRDHEERFVTFGFW